MDIPFNQQFHKKKKKIVIFLPPQLVHQFNSFKHSGAPSYFSFHQNQTSSLHLPELLSNLICFSLSQRGYIRISSQWIGQALWSL